MSEIEAELLRDLERAGFAATSPGDLVRTKRLPHDVFPVVLRWLDRLDQDDVGAFKRKQLREPLIRSLADPGARQLPAVSEALVKLFARTDIPDLQRWAVASSLNYIAHPTVFAELQLLASDSEWGKSREMLAGALARAGGAQAVDVLVRLLDDPQMTAHCLSALGDLADPRVEQAIRRFVDHERPLVRKNALRALERISQTWLSTEPCNGIANLNRQLVLALIERICAIGDTTVLYVNHCEQDRVAGINNRVALNASAGG